MNEIETPRPYHQITMAEDNAFCPGDPVLTIYGTGVIVQQRKDSFYAVRIWRIPGKSMASSALALLAPSAVS